MQVVVGYSRSFSVNYDLTCDLNGYIRLVHIPFSTHHMIELVVNLSASHMVGRGFAFRPGHTKDHHEYGTNCFPAQARML